MATQLKKKYIGNDQIDGDKIKLLAGQTLRKDDGNGGSIDVIGELESDIAQVQTNLDSEVSARQSADAQLASDLSSETNARIQAFQGIDARLITVEGDNLTQGQSITQLQSDLTSEVNTRILADQALDGRLSTAEGSIVSQGQSIGQLQSDLTSEVNTRIFADQALDGRLSSAEGTIVSHGQSITQLQSDLASETNTRISADQNLQDQINALSGGGSGSISSVQAELDTTQGAIGLNADGTLPSGSFGNNYVGSALSVLNAVQLLDIQAKTNADAISGEVSRAQAAEANLQSQIDNVLSNVDGAALDSLTEIVSAFQSADSNLNGAITQLATELAGDISAEEVARIAADSALQSAIDSVDGYAIDVRSDLDQEIVDRAAAVAAEQAARVAADNALDARVDVLESVVWFKESFNVTTGQTSVTLSHTPEAYSMTAFVGRLGIHEGSDFSISGSTMTFSGDLAPAGQSPLENGDIIFVKYQYKA